jgi:hypothetical protein
MNVIALSSAAWRFHADQSLSLISRFAKVNKDEFVVITKTAAEREQTSKESFLLHTLVELTDFVDMGTSPDGVLDIYKIRELPFTIPSNTCVILNATGSRSHLIESFLFQCRHGWYDLEEWHQAFILIADDAILLDVSMPLSNTFYIQPEFLSEPELRAYTRSILRDAKTLLYYGHFIGRIHNRLMSYRDQVEQRKIEKDTQI